VARAKSLIHDREYAEARDVLQAVPDTAPAAAEARRLRQALVTEIIPTYEKSVIQRAQEQLDQGDWEAAVQAFNEGLERLPDSRKLRDGKAHVQALRQDYLDELRMRQALLRADSLPHEADLERQILKADPDDSQARDRLAEINDAMQTVAGQLVAYGRKALEDESYALAQRCLQAAYRIRPDKDVDAMLARAREGAARSAARLAKVRSREEARQFSAMLGDFDKALAAGDLATARSLMHELVSTHPDATELDGRQRDLDRRIASRVQAGIRSGQKDYVAGNISQALTQWQALLALDPDNQELRAHIRRAKRVLDKIRSLKGE
jgi:tetratricopeptide (TPR) repeat protein